MIYVLISLVLKPSLGSLHLFKLRVDCVSVVSAPSGYPRVKAPICPSFKHISETAPDPDWDLILFPLLLILSLVIFCQSGTRKMAVGFEENLIFFKLHNWIYYHFF